MNDDIIRMARESGLITHVVVPEDVTEKIKHFANLVAAAERNRTWTQDHWTEYERSIAAAEREACAKVCNESANEAPNSWQFRMGANHCAGAIRARGQV